MKIEKLSLDYLIKSYECDHNGTLRILTLMNILQDAADNHATRLKVGIEHCLANGLAWVGTHYHIKIFRMPKWHEKITVTTWPSGRNRLVATRDFGIKDEAGNDIIVASSQWVLLNYEKKRPVSLEDNLPPYTVVEERALASDFAKIADVTNEENQKYFAVRYDDIDVNNHVNNAVYPLWATEAVPAEMRLNHIPIELEIAFKKECLYGETTKVLTEIRPDVKLNFPGQVERYAKTTNTCCFGLQALRNILASKGSKATAASLDAEGAPERRSAVDSDVHEHPSTGNDRAIDPEKQFRVGSNDGMVSTHSIIAADDSRELAKIRIHWK